MLSSIACAKMQALTSIASSSLCPSSSLAFSSSSSPSSSCQPWRGAPLPAFKSSFSALPRLSLRRSQVVSPFCKVPAVSQDTFQDNVLKAELPVLVGFCADWCGPCKLIGPIMESVGKDFEGSLKMCKVETDSNPDLVKEYDVYGLPTLILFKDGKEVPGSRKEGTINAKKLKELLNGLLSSAATT